MKKIILGMFKHETNSFAPGLTDRNAYKKRNYFKGGEALSFYRGTNSEPGGVLRALEAEKDITIVPSVFFDATPGAVVSREMWKEALDGVLSAAKSAGKPDGVLLCLHGAMITEDTSDGEGALLRELRRELGNDVPVVCTLDLHANVSSDMVKYSTALFPYHHNPHVDYAERGEEAARCLLSVVKGEKVYTGFCKLPLLLENIYTFSGVMGDIEKECRALEKSGEVISVSVCHGFIPTDSACAGASVIAEAKDTQTAQKYADLIGKRVWDARRELMRKWSSLDEAFSETRGKKGPFCFADTSDNPGGGGSGDSTHLLRAMIEADVKNAAFALIVDPETVEKAYLAGEGADACFEIGGKTLPEINGEPVKCRARVLFTKTVSYKNTGVMQTGLSYTLGRTALLRVGDIDIIVCENRLQPLDPEIFRACGIDPLSKDILAVKSSIHFKCNYETLAKKIYDLKLPGLTAADLKRDELKLCPRPIFPIDEI